MTVTAHLRRAAVLATAAALLPALAAPPAPAAKRKSCTRGGAKLEAAAGKTRVVRKRMKLRSRFETRRVHVLACWRPTGRRVTIAQEVDNGLDNIASTDVEIVDRRYVGVREQNEGGVSSGRAARVYDARRGRLLHSSDACEQIDQGDFAGVNDVAFLEGGGMAMACNALFLFRRAGSEMETLEPVGTRVLQIAVSRDTEGFGPRLFWTVAVGDGEETRSRTL